ncbi:MAG TPA: ferritin-like domain-containing protein [Steroidobacteraceae bacterium]|nr:ferritin-like domain-containing protein [Steroidobacteraceae bacterium]
MRHQTVPFKGRQERGSLTRLRPLDAPELPWRLEDVDFGRLDASLVRDDERLFYLLASASFVESGASLYTRNLIDYYRDDSDACAWLSNHWEAEELQHGRALRTYVQAAWPDFDWHGGYARFMVDYGALCSMDELEPTHALELAARCVVETGTATYYRMLCQAAREPVLHQILDHIRRDEVRHFKHFYRFFLAHRAAEKTSRTRIAAALLKRGLESTDEDGFCAFRHTYETRYPKRLNVKRAYRAFRREVHRLALQHYPHRMAAEMFLTPLGLGPRTRRSVVWALTRTMRVAL